MKVLIILFLFFSCSTQKSKNYKAFQAKLVESEIKRVNQKKEIIRKPAFFGVVIKKIDIKDEEDRKAAWLFIPKKYSPNKKWPLVISLHGYFGTPFFHEIINPFFPHINKKNFLLVFPKGLKDKKKWRYWNATKACCDFDNRNPNDVKYLRELIGEISKSHNIDSKKIFLYGHSNGGFMGYKMACEASDLISGVVSFGGASFLDPRECKNTHPVTILEIHGKNDQTIKYDGAKDWHPSVEETIMQWTKFNGCSDKNYSISNIKGARTGKYKMLEQKIWRFCKDGKKVALWTSEKGGHTYLLGTQMTKKILNFLF
ncbi:MAG: hypothetical protein DRQ88_12790 [Epsilonproteobacteria bacterium]|nr:MAG: hypothetical protein DRQ88_12790 [Campylobacterota bacterium]